MIKTKSDLKYYMECDRVALKYDRNKPKLIGSDIWKFQILLRKTEYYINNQKNLLFKIIAKFYSYRLYRKQIKLGFLIPPNTFGPGLAIAHIGTIVVNSNAKIGSNCRIHEGVTIGANGYGSKEAPLIGDNVFIGTGAKIIGNIVVADGISIGAGSIVVKSFNDGDITIAGNPAKKISDNNSDNHLVKATNIIQYNRN